MALSPGTSRRFHYTLRPVPGSRLTTGRPDHLDHFLPHHLLRCLGTGEQGELEQAQSYQQLTLQYTRALRGLQRLLWQQSGVLQAAGSVRAQALE